MLMGVSSGDRPKLLIFISAVHSLMQYPNIDVLTS
uniref:Uncharacterized protein n=1 Tax=Anguilla anguilla TaxID=7936 RepID=A0A0E9QXK4_ANGAN